MPYTPILATLAYVLDPSRSQVLMIHRNTRPQDEQYGKYNGLGGKLRRDEDVVAGLHRELDEEAGIEPVDFVLAGTISWPGFGKGGEDWFGFIFRVESFVGEPKRENPEGTLSWVALSELDDLPMWEGDRHFLPLVFADPLRPFHGVLPYHQGRPQRWSCSFI